MKDSNGGARRYLRWRSTNMRSARNRFMIRNEMGKAFRFRLPRGAHLRRLWEGPPETEGRALFSERYGQVAEARLEEQEQETRRAMLAWAGVGAVLFLMAIWSVFGERTFMGILAALVMAMGALFCAALALVQGWVIQQMRERRILGMREVLHGPRA